jgi:hypothetical protein
MRSNQFTALEREEDLWGALDSVSGGFEGIKNFVETRRHYKNDVFIALAR